MYPRWAGPKVRSEVRNLFPFELKQNHSTNRDVLKSHNDEVWGILTASTQHFLAFSPLQHQRFSSGPLGGDLLNGCRDPGFG